MINDEKILKINNETDKHLDDYYDNQIHHNIDYASYDKSKNKPIFTNKTIDF